MSETRCLKGKALPQEISFCPKCGPRGRERALVRCPEHGLRECGPFLYAGSLCLHHKDKEQQS